MTYPWEGTCASHGPLTRQSLGLGRGVWRRALERAPERAPEWAPERERGRVLPYVNAVRFRVISRVILIKVT